MTKFTEQQIDDRAEGETRGVDGATPSIKGPSWDAATVVYTEQQIDDYCEKIDNLCLTAHSDGRLLFEAVQIIRQLQGEV